MDKRNEVVLLAVVLATLFCSINEANEFSKENESSVHHNKKSHTQKFNENRKVKKNGKRAEDVPQESRPEPSIPDQTAPKISTSGANMDVGQVNIVGQTKSCNGVLLEPTFVLTTASCVHTNHKVDAFDTITFTVGMETKPVKKVFPNPYWRLSGERKSNFALLQLQQPMPHINAGRIPSITWSSYRLEDLGDSFIADLKSSSCNTASKKAQNSDVIDHVQDQEIILSCANKATFDQGSPIFQIRDNAPVIYGVYFGDCTAGSLDRAVSGSCGARITKKVFLDFCRHSLNENVQLPGCDNKILKQTHTNFPTTVFSREGYDAMLLHNPKATIVLAYHSSASKHYQDFLEDMEIIQTMKSVYKNFQIVTIDVNILPVRIKSVPFIEYKTKSSDMFLSYNDPYDFTSFKKFMDAFGKVGVPPSGSTSFLATLQEELMLDNKGKAQQSLARSQDNVLTVKSSGGKQPNTPSKIQCETKHGYYLSPDKLCTCMPTHFGDGKSCKELQSVIQSNCQFFVNDKRKNYLTILNDVKRNTWCDKEINIQSKVTANKKVSGKLLTSDHCSDAIREIIKCSNEHRLILKKKSSNWKEETDTQRHSLVNTKLGKPPSTYLSNFEQNTPPGPLTMLPNTHYYSVQGIRKSKANPYSVLFDGNKGIPVLVGYKVNNTNMKGIDLNKIWMKNKWTFIEKTGMRVGRNKIYMKRSNITRPEAMQEGQLNMNQMHSYNDESMDITFNHLNAFPIYREFAQKVWKKYQRKMISYAKTRCSTKDESAVFNVVSGLSDYELTGQGTTAFLKATTFWPVAYPEGISQPFLTPNLTDGFTKSITKPKSVWTIGCCTWTKSGEKKAETVSFWANNKPRGIAKHEIQPNLEILSRRLQPNKPTFQFFPANPLCGLVENHHTLEY